MYSALIEQKISLSYDERNNAKYLRSQGQGSALHKFTALDIIYCPQDGHRSNGRSSIPKVHAIIQKLTKWLWAIYIISGRSHEAAASCDLLAKRPARQPARHASQSLHLIMLVKFYNLFTWAWESVSVAII